MWKEPSVALHTSLLCCGVLQEDVGFPFQVVLSAPYVNFKCIWKFFPYGLWDQTALFSLLFKIDCFKLNVCVFLF